MIRSLLITIVFFTANNFLFAQDNIKDNTNPPVEVGIYEQLGNIIPSDVSFMDETGKPVNLKGLVNKPTILSLVYFRCPGICSPLMNGLSKTLDKVDLEQGKDFDVITISFDYTEDYIMASEKKKNYLDHMKKKIPSESWRFLTGDSISIAKISNAVGFKFQRQGNDFMHGAAIMVLSPEGKLIRYLYGTDFLPLDLKLAVLEASEGKIVPSINKLLKMCYSYDPQGRKYVLNVTRIAGGGMIVLLVAFVLMLTMKKKKINKTNIIQNG